MPVFYLFSFFFFFNVVLRIDPSDSHMLGKPPSYSPSPRNHFNNSSEEGLVNFLVKVQEVNITLCGGHMITFVTTQVYHSNPKSASGNM